MSEQKINPGQVTKPIQLLAAWLVGLILINGAFLSAASLITKPDWAPGLLVIAAVLNVPAFLFFIFYLQTKFRAELQEDTYYSKHLEALTGQGKQVAVIESSVHSELKNIQISNGIQFDLIAERFDTIVAEIRNSASSVVVADSTALDVGSKVSVSDRQKSLVSISLNDLIPDYKLIARELIANGYNVEEYFGGNSLNQCPKYLTISYGEAVPKAILKSLYSILKPFGFEYIDCDDDPYRPKPSNVWVGSYIDPEDGFNGRVSVKIDDYIEGLLLDDQLSIDNFTKIIRSFYTE